MTRLDALRALSAEAQAGELVFATSVAAASRIRKGLDDPDIHVATAARLIETEPLLAARCVALANSVAYGRSGPAVTGVSNAVGRLGLRTVRMLAEALIVRQLAGTPRDAGRQAAVSRLWERTAHVSSLARLIAQRITHVDAETALFAGLVHDVGSFYRLSRIAQYPSLADQEQEPEEEDCEIAINRAVVAQLALPEAIVEALEVVWTGYIAMPTVSLGDTVALAKALVPNESPFATVQSTARIAPLDMTIGEETLTRILQESKEELRSLAQALVF